ncbi:MAG: cyclodeaminase/cyclohydrolase family protein [Fusobacterium gastrosuis]|uniref:cyclodeaminase/cyclohydrolase family protein n=1 Tax=Fusobacterium TaxID=848 RepID=UPI001F4FFAC0|nr:MULTISPECIES: cyclodeaminase/cyclohydrolase family protein [Fusobacterium]MDD7391947.1 cyclodeaminase/cyclohydrolase family protein [Fusobacteriaceae bacterium]MCI5725019.1 cyclodeaminase/cyclohydrolase family protein [Fusobacterium sp.]MCI7223981.1 cyclodeaminase/cyclohydrolase family protein [Fusobacterium sp.]MDD7410929.1 cyclodeaminase/cyclohydrolase family protein [Fusobacteriaceae bacterium]MDY4011740.1 cyclodeaminase/cyclohydrolase family protein [Fusobacterium gastrosuis]
MKLVEMDVIKFLNEVDSNSPAPGGGSVAALASSLGVSLGRMVAHLSFGKKKYEANSDEAKAAFVKNFDELLKIKDELNVLIDKDSEAYNTVMAAFKLPKETDEEKAIRNAEIQKCTKFAIQTPYDIVVLSGKAISLLGTILEYGNQNAITDIGVGTMLLMTGLEGGILNVKVNLSSIEDQEYVQKISKEIAEIKATAAKEVERIMNIVNAAL